MKKLTYVYILALLTTAGCAKFDFLQGSGFVTAFQIQTPIGGTVLVPGSTFTVTGICEADGGLVTVTGSSMVEASINGACDPTLGTFSINATAVPSGEMLDIQASQTDNLGNPLSASINSIMIHCAGAPMQTCAVSGSGNSSDPYLVDDILCLQEMRTGLTCSYALNNDIDASAVSALPGGWEPVPNTADPNIRFTGRLDGQNHTISNLYITPRTTGGAGLFSRLFDEGNGSIDDQVFDLTLDNVNADQFSFGGNTPFGFIAGETNLVGLRNVRVLNSDIDLSANSNRANIALISGLAVNSRIADSQTSGSILLFGTLDEVNNKYEGISGFVGRLEGSSINDSSSIVTISTNALNVMYFTSVGGAFGSIIDSTVSRFRTTSNISLIHTGINAFSNGGIGNVGGFAGLTQDSTTLNDICVNHTINLQTASSNIGDSAGFIGRMSFMTGFETNQRISLRGTLNVDANGNEVDQVAGYIGRDFGPSLHEDIFLDSDISIPSGVSPIALAGYGGLISANSGSSSFENIVAVSSHNINPGINNPGGVFHDISGSPITSIYYANDVALGGLPAEGTGGGGSIVSDSFANLAVLPNGSYTGFDFATVWQRDPGTGIPELRYCP